MIYLDNAASSLMLDEVKEALTELYQEQWVGANPNSLHAYGRRAFSELEQARKELARSIGAARPSELIFTSGGTESDNMALIGIALGLRQKGSKRDLCAFSALEHEAIGACVDELKALGFECITLPVCSNGLFDLEYAEKFIAEHGSRLAVASLMLCHNEFGVIQPVRELSRLVHAAGAYMHSDAVQAFGYIPCDVQELELDACSITAHKLGGPTGIGALYLKARTPFSPRSFGGGQEQGRRSGTQQVEQALAFNFAAQLRLKELENREKELMQRREMMYEAIEEAINNQLVSLRRRIAQGAAPIKRLIPEHIKCHPGMVVFAVYKLEAEALILQADAQGICIASGSACASSSLEPSHSVKAIGLERDYAYGVLRLSFDERVSCDELKYAADVLAKLIVELMIKEGIAVE